MRDFKANFKDIYKVLKPFWVSEKKVFAWAMLATIIAISILQVVFSLKINTWYVGFYDAIQNLEQAKFYSSLIVFTYLVIPLILMGTARVYLAGWLGIIWRKWVTDSYVGDYLDKNAFLQLEAQHKPTDNPDQRLSYDLQQITSDTIELLMTLVHELTTIASFSVILWNISGSVNLNIHGVTIHGYLFWCSLGFAVFGTLMVVVVGKKLTKLQFNQERYEAGFRFGLMRVREWRDSIALLDGKLIEGQTLDQKFKDIIVNFMQLLVVNVKVDLSQSFYFQAMVIFPFVVAGPMLFSKAITFGVLMQIVHAFGTVNGSMSTIVAIYPRLTAWRATSERIVELTKDIHEVHNYTIPVNYSKKTNDGLLFKNLCLSTQAGHIICEKLNIDIAAGQKVLLMAPSGYGKSTITKALAQIWPYASGEIHLPQSPIFFLPQKPYMPITNLRTALCYPDDHTRYGDARLIQVLNEVELPKLESQLDEVADWANLLSLGEQQRLGFARVLLKKPKCLVLDEPSSALDQQRQYNLFTKLFAHLPNTTIITIGHNHFLKELHDSTIDLASIA